MSGRTPNKRIEPTPPRRRSSSAVRWADACYASLAPAYRGGGYDPQIGLARYTRAANHADEAAALPPNTLRRLTPTPGIRADSSLVYG